MALKGSYSIPDGEHLPQTGTLSPTVGNTSNLSLTKVIGFRVRIHFTLQTLGEGF